MYYDVALEKFEKIKDKEDKVILVTSRTDEYKEMTINFLKENGIRFDEIIFNCPYGERIIINDDKPGGLVTSHAVRLKRDEGLKNISIKYDETI